MKTSEQGIRIIKKYEHLSLTAYKDEEGEWMIGYGHKTGVSRGDKTNETGATEMLKEDLLMAEKTVSALKIELCQEQFDALVSLVQGIGVSSFRKYWAQPLKEDSRSGAIYDLFMRWCMKTDAETGEKVKDERLLERRKEEAELYFS